jgi:hypothetical protein
MLAAGLIASWINYKTPEQLAEVKAAIARSQPTPVPVMPTVPTPQLSTPAPEPFWLRSSHN